MGDLELGKPQNYGRIEYAYHLMAKSAGITMTECRLLEESNRAHFNDILDSTEHRLKKNYILRV